MKRIAVCFSLILCSLLVSVTVYASRGVVAYYDFSSSKIVIQTDYNSYTCAEVYTGGLLTGIGSVIVGDLETYGFKEVYDVTTDEELSIYIDDYWVSKARALNWIKRGY